MGRRVLSFLTTLALLLGLASPAGAAPPGPSSTAGRQGARGGHGAQRAASAPKPRSGTPVVGDRSSGGRNVKAATPRPASRARAAAAFDESYGDDQLLTAPTQWWTVNGWTAEQIVDYARSQDARISDLAVQPGSQVLFTATLVKNTGAYWVSGWGLWYGLTEAGVVDTANAYSQRPVSISRYWTSDGWRFAVALLDNTGAGARGWWWYYGDQNYVIGQQQAIGGRVTRVRPFDDGGTRRYDMLMSGSDQTFWWWFGGSDGAVNDQIRQNGARIVDASRNDDGTFNAIMLRNTTGYSPGWWHGFTHDELKQKALRMGGRLITAQGYTENGRERFIGTMSREAASGTPLATAMVQNTVVHTALAHGGGAVAELSDSTLGKIGYAFGTTVDARVRIASVSKTFAAAELMKLAAAGTVSLDAPVSTYLPGVNGGGSITLRMLLRHTSGLYNFTEDQPDFATTMTQGFTYAQLLEIVNRHAPVFAPGARYSYSNSNYLVIGMIIERLTGRSYSDAVFRDIIGPLGLSATSVPSDTAISSVRLRGYWWDPAASDAVEVTGQNASRWATGGQMISSVSDLNTFYKALLRGSVTGAAGANEMKSSLVYSGVGSKYAGLGIFRTTWCGKNVYWHDGSIPGYRTWSVHSEDGSRSLSWAYSDQRRADDVDFDDEFIQDVFCYL
ncbi:MULTISPECIES: serine hydrolase domain-containing protein [Thermomonosporaceae]|uniref:serine hydrolase domain-containing protein n=1 Tax=Thermomonosporaceae TaxID=2012 RepID=UPI00255AE612|nr:MULTISPECIES: serine hydrolase domain-containing protein [Thermomonosporaceae]MDL4776586.1 serine hydrolase domain-containing protein [Actinomadura xylanilytica]